MMHFLHHGFSLIISQSFEKVMGLYGERVGALHMVLPESKTARNVKSQIRSIIRNNYSTPPHHGAAIVTTILSNKELNDKWKEELKEISVNLKNMR